MTIRFAAAALLFAGWFMPTAQADDRQVLRTETGAIPAKAVRIKADNAFGPLTVTSGGADFGWEWTLRGTAHGSMNRVEEYARQCRLEVRENADGFELVVVRPEQSKRGVMRSGSALRHFLSVVTLGSLPANDGRVESELKLRIPDTAAVELKSRFGNVQATGLRSRVVVENQHGRVELTDIQGEVTARNSFGSTRAQRVGPCDLASHHGSLEVWDVAGNLQAKTSFSSLKVADIKGNAALKNENGAIHVARVSGDLAAETSFGDLRVERVGGTVRLKGRNTRIQASDITGELTADTSFGGLHVNSIAGPARLHNKNGMVEATRVTGELVAETSFADLRVQDIGGKADLTTRNGKIEATRVTGDVRVRNSFAPVRLRDINGDVDVEGKNSDFVVAGVSGDIRAQTSFARMRLEGRGRRFVARNQNGAVDITAQSPAVEHIEVTASFAPIDVRLPAQAKPLIRASTSHGRVQSPFPILPAEGMSDAAFVADATPLKVSLKGENANINIRSIGAR